METEVKVEKKEIKKTSKKYPKVEILIPVRDEHGRYEVGEVIEFKGTKEELERLEKIGAVAKV